MSNIHIIGGTQVPTALPAAPKTRKVRQKIATAAEIARVVRTANILGLTIYGVEVDGPTIKIITKPEVAQQKEQTSEADAWFASRG